MGLLGKVHNFHTESYQKELMIKKSNSQVPHDNIKGQQENTYMSVAGKLAEFHDINNMAPFIASHLQHSTYAPNYETHKTRNKVITPKAINLLNNDGS